MRLPDCLGLGTSHIDRNSKVQRVFLLLMIALGAGGLVVLAIPVISTVRAGFRFRRVARLTATSVGGDVSLLRARVAALRVAIGQRRGVSAAGSDVESHQRQLGGHA